jgi:hypothetical protein
MLGASELLSAGLMAIVAGALYEGIGASGTYAAASAVMLLCVGLARVLGGRTVVATAPATAAG